MKTTLVSMWDLTEKGLPGAGKYPVGTLVSWSLWSFSPED